MLISECSNPRNNPSLMQNPINKIAELYCPYEYIYENNGRYLPDETDAYGREYMEYYVLVKDEENEQKIIYIYSISKEGEIRYTYHMTKNWIKYSEYELSEEEIQQFKEDNCWNEPIEGNPNMMLYDDYMFYDGYSMAPNIDYDQVKEEYAKMERELGVESSLYKHHTPGRMGIAFYIKSNKIIVVLYQFNLDTEKLNYEIANTSERNLAEYSEFLANEYFATWEGYIVQD